MEIDYDRDRIAEQYKEAKRQPWRSLVETYSLMNHLGDLRGKRVVDLACGEGYFTRLLKQAGAAEVVGVDISHRMIDLAREQEADDPLGIEYRVGDVRTVIGDGDFDLAVSAWLLVYAQDREELGQMCQGVSSWVKPGGRFVTFTTNPDLYFFQPKPDYRKYGFDVTLAKEAVDGAPILFTIFLQDALLDIDNYYLPIMAHMTAFQQAGFERFRVHNPKLDPRVTEDRDYWDEMLTQPPAVLFDVTRQ